MWKEIEARANVYRQEQKDKAKAIRARTKLLDGPGGLEWKQEQEALEDEILGELSVERSLEAVRSEVWEEGIIEPWSVWHGGLTLSKGFSLISNQYLALDFAYPDASHVDLRVSKRWTRLKVELNSYESGKGKRRSRLEIEDSYLYDMRGRSPYLGLETRKRKSLSAALGEIIGLDHLDFKTMFIVDQEDPDRLERFFFELVRHSEERGLMESMPGQLRDFWSVVISQLPDELVRTGMLPISELKQLESELRGSSRFSVVK